LTASTYPDRPAGAVEGVRIEIGRRGLALRPRLLDFDQIESLEPFGQLRMGELFFSHGEHFPVS
jgi:hypothetical protein